MYLGVESREHSVGLKIFFNADEKCYGGLSKCLGDKRRKQSFKKYGSFIVKRKNIFLNLCLATLVIVRTGYSNRIDDLFSLFIFKAFFINTYLISVPYSSRNTFGFRHLDGR